MFIGIIIWLECYCYYRRCCDVVDVLSKLASGFYMRLYSKMGEVCMKLWMV